MGLPFNTLVMIIQQKSLKEFTLINNTGDHVNVSFYKYVNNEFVPGQYVDSTLSYEGDTNIIIFHADNAPITVVFNSDGIYKMTFNSDDYIIHNISDLLLVRQEFLTKALKEYSIDKCNTNSYVDYCTFVLLFDTYLDLVEHLFSPNIINNTRISFSMLHKLDYLYNQLLKYKP
jgi:hypothetical protein